MPDIMLLPRLASFFDVTVDALLGYEPQLTREEIRGCYHRLASEFANLPFEEVMEESERLVKKYYSCYPFLMQVCILWLNHFMMAEKPERKQAILDQIAKLCVHITVHCKDISICNNAVMIKSLVDLQSGKAREVIEALGDGQDVNRLEEKNNLLVQAYLMMGELDKADKAVQVNLYQSAMQMLTNGNLLLMLHSHDEEKCQEILRRTDAMVQFYDLENLNPNAVAGYQYQAAVTMCTLQREEEALERLDKYADAARRLFEGDVILHGDGFFNRLDEWFADLELGSESVRDRKLIEETALEAFDLPVIRALSNQKRVAQIREKIAEVCKSSEKQEEN